MVDRRAVPCGLAAVSVGVFSGLFGTPREVDAWHEVSITLPYGATDFAALGALELSGLYRVIRDW